MTDALKAPAPPLWKLLHACASTVLAVQKGQSGTAALETVPMALRPAVQALTFQVWRNLGRADALRRLLAAKAPAPAVDALLRVALALVWQPEHAPYDAFTLVNQTVEAAKKQASTRAQAGFVNACLRRFLRERDALVAQSDGDPVARWNHPHWWIAALQKDHPDHWQEILSANNTQPPLTLRVNTRRISVAAYTDDLEQVGITAHRVGTHGLTLERAVPVQALPGFSQGLASVQDYAAQMAAPLLLGSQTWPKEARILDACAAPGGKTAHLLELTDAQVFALEQDPQRALRIQDNLKRLGLAATQVITADAGTPEAWWDGQPFQGILLDAPCTASGIVRRHPDIRWLRRPTDIAQLATQQRRLLAALWPLLAPGGRMLYCTCSVFAAEGREQAQAFLAHNTDARMLGAPGHLLPQKREKVTSVPENQACDHDGFFYLLLYKAPMA